MSYKTDFSIKGERAMNREKQAVISLLNQSYSFLSISGKNSDFLSSVSEDVFFFREETDASHILSVPAGGEITYTVPVRFTHTCLPYAVLCYVKSGEGTLTIRRNQTSSDHHASSQEQSCTLSSDDLLFIPENMACNFATARTPFTYDVFYLTGGPLSDYVPFLCEETGFFHHNRTELDGALKKLWEFLLAHLPKEDSLSCLHISAMLHLVLSTLAQGVQPACDTALPAHVAQMKEIFDTDYQSPHSLTELEALLGISRYRLCHDFSKHIGTSPLQYLNQRRIHTARYLLRSTDLSIREVGAAVGIENTTHFINLFKKSAGITPLQFRQTSVL